jgi:hypothetical protein
MLSDLRKHTQVILSKELLKLLESMRYHSWKYIVTLDEAWFYLSIFLLITNQFGSVQKMKLHKGREKLCHLRRLCWQSSGTHTDFTWLMFNQRATNLNLDIISLTFYHPYPKFLLLIKMVQRDIFWFKLTMPDLVVPKRLLSFESQFHAPNTSSSLFVRSGHLRLMAFQASERSTSKEFIRRTWWILVCYPWNFDESWSWNFGYSISRIDDHIVEMYWWKWWICWAMFKMKCLIPVSKR